MRDKIGGLRVDLVFECAVGPFKLRELNSVFSSMIRQP